MFSKNTFRALALGFLLIAGLTGCTAKVGEKPPPPPNIELGATKCLSKSAEDLKGFFSAKVSDEQLTTAWNCLGSAFVQFEKYVRGRDADRYTSQEIVEFLETNFFEDSQNNRISPGLQIELMKLKQVFIGGSLSYITRDELKKMVTFINQINGMTVELNPFMKIIVDEWKPKLDSANKSNDLEQFEVANAALQKFANQLADIIGQNQSQYNLSDIISLSKEFQSFFKTSWGWIGDVERLMPGLKKLKVGLAGGNENSISQKEWSPVLTLGARGYFQYLRYHYFIESTPETGGAVRLVYVARTMEDIFSIFQDLVSHKEGGVVTSKELYEILNAFQQFWTQLKVSEKLVYDFMKIKQVLIGGAVDTWTVEDFEQARLKVPELRRIIENFLPFFSVYANEWEPDAEDPIEARNIFSDAKNKLYTVAQDAAHFLVGSYSYDDLLELAQEIDHLYPDVKLAPKSGDPANPTPKPTKNLTGVLQPYRDVFFEAQKILFAQTDTTITKEQWGIVLPLVARFYSHYQFYKYFLSNKSLKATRGILDMGIMVEDSLTTAQDLFRLKKEGYFTQDEMVSLSIKLSQADILPQNIKPETYKSLWTAVLQYVFFSPDKRLAGEKNTLLRFEQFELMKAEFEIWRKTQLVANDIFQDSADVAFTPSDMLKILQDKILQNAGTPDLRVGLEGIYGVLNSKIPTTLDNEGQMQISNRVNWQYKINALYQANLTRTLSRILLRSFATDKNLSQVNECEANTAFGLLVGVFRDLHIFDPSPTFISSRFLEANIFMGRANGDKFLDYYELSDLINVLFSGLRVNGNLQDSLRIACPVYKTAADKEFVTFACMTTHYYGAVRKYMTQLPDFKGYVDALAAKDKPPGTGPGFNTWKTVFNQTLRATGWIPNSGYDSVREDGKKVAIKEQCVYLDDAVYYPFIIHYMELLYARFDANKNGSIQASESKMAFPTFQPLLLDLAKDQINKHLLAKEDLLALFNYILVFKEEPGIWTYFRWNSWRMDPPRWDREVNVGRTDVAQVLGFIADKTRESKDDSPPVCK